MMENKKISVIIPIYNMEEYLEKCIQSVIKQTYTNLEIILVNDGSTDSSLEICKKYQSLDERIAVINKQNEGLAAARKSGIDRASGDYITFVDADDWIEQDAYESLMESAEDEDMMIYGLIEDYDNRHIEKRSDFDEGLYNIEAIKETIIPAVFDTDIFFKFNLIPNLVCKIIKRDLIKEAAACVSNNVTMGEDVDFTCQLLEYVKTIRISKLTPYHYVQRKSSMVRSYTPKESLYALYNDLHKINFADELREQWNYQIHVYMSFILQLKCMERYIEGSSFFDIFKGKSVIIYGAGNYGLSVGNAMKNMPGTHIAAVSDREWTDKKAAFAEIAPVIAPEDILSEKFDYIYIAILNEDICKNIKAMLIKMGADSDKIIYYKMNDINVSEINDITGGLKI